MDRMRMYYTCTIAPGRKRCRIFSKISFCNTSHATVRSKYRMKGLPNLQGSQKEFSLHQFNWWYHPYDVLWLRPDCKCHTCCSIPASLLSSTGSVTHQQDNFLRLPAVLIGTLRRGCQLLYLCGYSIICTAILQVVLVEICMCAS